MAKVTRDLLEYESIVMDELLAHGYPKESIVLEGQVDTRRFVDFIINDIDTGLPMMMIEMKSCGERTQTAVRQLAFDSLKRYYNKNASPIKAVAAILDREKKKLEFIDYTEAVKEDNFDRAVNDYSLPPYEILTIGARQKAINQQKEKHYRVKGALLGHSPSCLSCACIVRCIWYIYLFHFKISSYWCGRSYYFDSVL